MTWRISSTICTVCHIARFIAGDTIRSSTRDSYEISFTSPWASSLCLAISSAKVKSELRSCIRLQLVSHRACIIVYTSPVSLFAPSMPFKNFAEKLPQPVYRSRLTALSCSSVKASGYSCFITCSVI